jgi:hypothetical protein
MATRLPLALGLTICEDVVVEAPSRDVSLIRSFTGLPVEHFPTIARPLCVFSALTDGSGAADILLQVGHFSDTYEEVYRAHSQLAFPDPLRIVYYVMRLARCPLPGSGIYLFTLSANGFWLAQRSLRVYSPGATP